MKIRHLMEGAEPKLAGAPEGIQIMTPQQFVASAGDMPGEESEEGVAEGEYKSRHIHRQEQNKKYDEYCRSQEAAGKKPMSRGDWAATQRKGQKQGVAEASPETTLNLLKGLKTWQVVIMNNYYRGKYSDYSGRYYYVLASSPEEARQVVLDNADAILQDLLSMKSVNGKKILPRGSAIAITDKRIGDIKDGTEAGRMTTAGFKRMFGPQGPMMVKLSGGAVVDVQGQEQGVAEGSLNEGQYEMMMRNGQVKKFVAKDDADAKRIAAGHGAKSVIRLRGGVPAGKVSEQGVAEGLGNFAKAIDNLHGWYQVKSRNPDVEVYEFDDREGGFYADGTVYHNVKTGRVKIEFEDKIGEYGGMNVNDTFNSIGDAMNVLRQITIPIRPNNGKAQNFDRLGGRELAGPNDVYKTDRTGKKGTLTKSRMDTMKMSSPYRKTGPKGVLPEQGVAEGSLDESKIHNVIMAFAVLGGALIGGASGIQSHQNKQRWMQAYEQIKQTDPATAEQVKQLVNKYKSQPLKWGPDIDSSRKIEKIISDFENQKLKDQLPEQGVAESEDHLAEIRRLSGLDEATKLPAQSRDFGGQEFQDYMKRIVGTPDLDKEGKPKVDKKGIEKYVSGKTKGDRYKMPYIHRSSVIEYLGPDGQTYSEDKIKAALAQRPKKLLKQNEKMKHSNGELEQFFNVGFAALTGIALDEETNNLIIVNTCPGAGSCKVDCFAMKGGKVQFKAAWLSDGRILTYLLNDPDGFFNQLSAEIAKEEKLGDKGGYEVTIRWHDAGDFFSPEYLDMALKMAEKHPGVKFYAYTKMADAALATKPANFIINWSEGAHTSQEKQVKAADPDLETTKNSRIVPDELFQDLLVKDEKKNLVKGAEGQWQVQPDKLPELKQRLAKQYGLSANSILSYAEYMAKRKSIPAGMKYNVIVAPGEGDISANDPNIISTLLLKH